MIRPYLIYFGPADTTRIECSSAILKKQQLELSPAEPFYISGLDMPFWYNPATSLKATKMVLKSYSKRK
jgi:hypothetical protein